MLTFCLTKIFTRDMDRVRALGNRSTLTDRPASGRDIQTERYWEVDGCPNVNIRKMIQCIQGPKPKIDQKDSRSKELVKPKSSAVSVHGKYNSSQYNRFLFLVKSRNLNPGLCVKTHHYIGGEDQS